MNGTGMTLIGAIKHELHWRRELHRILEQRKIWSNNIVKMHLRAAAKQATVQIRFYRDMIDDLDSGDSAISENTKRAMRAYAARHGKAWRFRLRDDWKAGRVGGELKAFLDKWGPSILAWCKLALINPLEPSIGWPDKLQQPLAFQHL
jgi:hypothetical protein